MSVYQINILPVNVLNEAASIGFSDVEKADYARIFRTSLPRDFLNEAKRDTDFFWWNTEENSEAEDAIVEVDLRANKRFAKHFFNRLLFDHFAATDLLINQNFIKDTEVYVRDEVTKNQEYHRYNRFSLRFDTNDLLEGVSVLLTYDGSTFVHQKSIGELGLDTALVGRVLYGNRICKYSETPAGFDAEKFPCLTYAIRQQLKINLPPRNFLENKYKKYYDLITEFYETHLKDREVAGYIKFFGSGFYSPSSERISVTSEDSNLLVFGKNKTNFTPYVGLKEYGPLETPVDKPIRFIFIFHQEDRAFANKIYSYLRKGFKSFPGLESFVDIKFDLDTRNSVLFTDDPVSAVREVLDRGEMDTDSFHYAALYLSRIKKDSGDADADIVYYRLKELLLNANVASQVIYREHINNPSFNYFLPNIAIALLAKLGGIPWRLFRPIKNDLVVGVGADRSLRQTEQYVGCAFCFRNDGKFKGFNAFQKEDTASLGDAIADAIKEYTEENEEFDRLVIHYYKHMSFEEEAPIRKTLETLDVNLPYVIVSVNETESRDYVLFDTSFDGLMPRSGAFMRVRRNEFILCNNTRYSRHTGTKLDGYPFPIKIRLKSANYEKIGDMAVVKELIDQVYQFSRMYWKSVRQRSMPVTIEYSKLVAEMIPFFEEKELKDFARDSLWFL